MADTLGHYFKRCCEQGIIDFSLRAQQEEAGESWVIGIQTCYECGHQWETEL